MIDRIRPSPAVRHSFRFKATLALILVLFSALCAGYYHAYAIGDFPDEKAHLGYVADVTERGFPDYRAGMIPGTGKLNYLPHPALYYMTAGSLSMFADDIERQKLVRVVNVWIGILILLTTWWGMRQMGLNALPIFVGLSLPIIVPMFVILSVSVNNDPLAIFGCTLVFVSFVLFFDEKRRSTALNLLIAGFVIACLSKATAALAAVCMTVFFVAFNYRLVFAVARNLRGRQIAGILGGALAVTAYFLTVHSYFGGFLPAPQGDPSDWFAVDNPNATRWRLGEHLAVFVESNVHTLTNPYGHAKFFDHALRERIVSIAMLSIPVFAWTALRGERREGSDYWRLVPVLACSFAAFLAVYFIRIRSMHLETGYPGAMQARYFFGFLPGVSILVALGMNHMRSRLLCIAAALLVASGLALSFYPAYFKSFMGGLAQQERSNTHYGELIPGRKFEQTFIAVDDEVVRVELLLATFMRNNSGTVDLQIIDRHGSVLGAASIGAHMVKDNDWAPFLFKGIRLVRGSAYTLRLTSKDSSPGNAVTWWSYEKSKTAGASSKLAGTPLGPAEPSAEAFSAGNAIVDRNIMEADFAFKIFFVRNFRKSE